MADKDWSTWNRFASAAITGALTGIDQRTPVDVDMLVSNAVVIADKLLEKKPAIVRLRFQIASAIDLLGGAEAAAEAMRHADRLDGDSTLNHPSQRVLEDIYITWRDRVREQMAEFEREGLL